MNNVNEVPAAKLAKLKSEAIRALTETRRTMMNRQPFTGAVAMNLDIVPIRDSRCRTACTDGKRVFFDIEFLSDLSADERLFVFAHEVWHNLMMHFMRGEGRDHELMNIATDLEVNQILVKDGMSAPAFALMPAQFGLQPDLSAEEYYNILAAKKSNMGSAFFDNMTNGGSSGGPEQNKGPTPFRDGDGRKTKPDRGVQFDRHVRPDDVNGLREERPGPDDFDKYGKIGTDDDFTVSFDKESVEKIREAAVSAAQVIERARGDLPAYIKSLVQSLTKPEINWSERLQQFVTRSFCGEKRNWNPPNRRHVHSGMYLQSRRGEKIRIAVGLDVSGSTMCDIPKFLAEVNGIVKSFGKYDLNVIQCDTEVKSCDKYSDDDPLDLENTEFEINGCGGTRLMPILDKVGELSEEGEQPDAVVILTDGGCEHFSSDDEIGVPVMWVVTPGGITDFTEFGEVVELKGRAA